MPASSVSDLLLSSEPRWAGKIGSSGVAADDTTTIPLSSAANLNNGEAYIFTINRVTSDGTKNTLAQMETCIGELSGTNFINCTRGVEGTASAWAADIVVEILFTATHWSKLVTWAEVEHNQDGTHSDIHADTIELGGDGATADNILDEDDMSSNSATALATQQSIKAYVDTQDTLYTNTNIGMARQAIINGNFDVSQRGTTFVAGANNDDVYTLDRWNLISDGNDVLDVSQEAVTDLPGSNYAIKLDVETAKRAGIVQFLEAKDAQKFKGKSVSISFAVKSANISAIRATVLSWASTADAVTSDVVGTWGATPTWAANWADNATPADLTVTSSWTTVKVENIAIDESTVNNLALAIWLPNEETIGDIIYISQVQMNMGSVALPFQPKSYGEELRACQRYYQKISQAVGLASTTTSCQLSLSFFVEMRTTPAISITSAMTVTDSTANFTQSTASAGTYIGNARGGVLNSVVNFSGLTQFRFVQINTSSYNDTLVASAEL